VDKSEERHFVGQLTRRDEAAWELFCQLYTAPLFAFIRYALGLDEEKSKEVVQSTFLRCVRSIGTFDPKRGELLQWLKTIARNEACTLFRQRKSFAAEKSWSVLATSAREEILEILDHDDLPEELLARRDLQFLVQEVLLTLGERHRKALVMKYIEDMKIVDISNQLKVSEKAVESLLSRARDAFRTVFLKTISDENTVEDFLSL
jgi:RNA polymerase sigma-70 factor, ECF subfamily